MKTLVRNSVASALILFTCLAGTAIGSVVEDTFDDNSRAESWLYEGGSGTCWLDEANQRLEVRSTSASDSGTGYASGTWRISPTADFSLRVDFRYNPVTSQEGWTFISFSPSLARWDTDHVDFTAGCDNNTPFFHCNIRNSGVDLLSESTGRSNPGGTLYVSYNAALDEMYLSYTGYGAAYAWQTVSGLLLGQWYSVPLLVGIGGGAFGVTLDSGDAFLDDFVVESGTLTRAVHRFWSPIYFRHFYTISESERAKLVNSYSHAWTYEQAAYHAFPAADGGSGAAPVYRFLSTKSGAHVYTISETEKAKLVDNYSHVLVYEGPVFYAYPDGGQPAGTCAVYRFWSESKGCHFYTNSETERDKLINQYSHVWTYERIAWYAYE